MTGDGDTDLLGVLPTLLGSDVLLGDPFGGMLLFMSGEVMRGIGRCHLCRTMFSFDPERVATVLIDPLTGKPTDLAGSDPEAAVQRPLCRLCVEYRVPFQRAVNAIKSRQEWDRQAQNAMAALARAEARAGRTNTPDPELQALDPAAFRDLIEAMHALEIRSGFRVPDQLMVLAGLERIDAGWSIPDKP